MGTPAETKQEKENPNKEYFDYLDGLRKNGSTNMFGAGSYLELEFGLDKKEANEILSEWMKDFKG